MTSTRYPAYPLIVHDPYFSIWSTTDALNDSCPSHWTGAGFDIYCIVRIDGISRCCMSNKGLENMPQKSVKVLPTRTIYTFEDLGVRFKLTFLTPALLNDLEVLSRPVSYVITDFNSIDGKKHQVSVLFGYTANCCVDNHNQKIQWGRLCKKGMDYLFAGSAEQDVLGKCGDNLRIDWGQMILAVPHRFHPQTVIGPNSGVIEYFMQNGNLPEEDWIEDPCSLRQGWTALCSVMDFCVPPKRTASAWHMFAYNDFYSVEFLNRKLRGYWSGTHKNFSVMLTAAMNEYEALREKCEAFDAELMADAVQYGGKEYANLLALTYRQSIGAHKLVMDLDGTPLFFSKENSSNGCIATVDITYPTAPLYLLMQPELVKGMMIPILEYANSYHWKFPFAPHDLGTYPLANGQVYGGGEETEDRQMPVEESGNLLLLAAALVKFTGDLEFVRKYQNLFRKWAEYLACKGFDPENQLCTDDFAGHLAHNANLSIKAILALAGYGMIAKKTGCQEEAKRYTSMAKKFAAHWVKVADDGECYRLAFDRPGTWSQKYNLIWDRLLELNCFPASVAEKELAWYRSHQNIYGLPLDSRKTYTKLDWTLWSAVLTGKDDDFQALMKPVWKWLQEGVSRVPVSDWYETVEDGRYVIFKARAVVGGLFIRLLAEKSVREKWLGKIKKHNR